MIYPKLRGTQLYTYLCLFVSLWCLQFGWAGLILLGSATFGFKLQIGSRSVPNILHSPWVSGYLSHVHGEKKMCEKANTVILAYFKLLLLLYSQTYFD